MTLACRIEALPAIRPAAAEAAAKDIAMTAPHLVARSPARPRVRSRGRPVARLALALALALAAGRAGAADQRQELAALYRLAVSNDLCEFPLTDAQAEALAHRTEELETALKLDEDATQALYEQVETELTAKVDSGLCKAGGAWAADYARQVEALSADK
jgi:hypothetical protein